MPICSVCDPWLRINFQSVIDQIKMVWSAQVVRYCPLTLRLEKGVSPVDLSNYLTFLVTRSWRQMTRWPGVRGYSMKQSLEPSGEKARSVTGDQLMKTISYYVFEGTSYTRRQWSLLDSSFTDKLSSVNYSVNYSLGSSLSFKFQPVEFELAFPEMQSLFVPGRHRMARIYPAYSRTQTKLSVVLSNPMQTLVLPLAKAAQYTPSEEAVTRLIFLAVSEIVQSDLPEYPAEEKDFCLSCPSLLAQTRWALQVESEYYSTQVGGNWKSVKTLSDTGYQLQVRQTVAVLFVWSQRKARSSLLRKKEDSRLSGLLRKAKEVQFFWERTGERRVMRRRRAVEGMFMFGDKILYLYGELMVIFQVDNLSHLYLSSKIKNSLPLSFFFWGVIGKLLLFGEVIEVDFCQ